MKEFFIKNLMKMQLKKLPQDQIWKMFTLLNPVSPVRAKQEFAVGKLFNRAGKYEKEFKGIK